MKIELILTPNRRSIRVEIELADLADNEDQWNELSDSDKRRELQKYIDTENEDSPYWELDSFNLTQ